MDMNSFKSRLAHCNVGPGKRTHDGAMQKCEELLNADITMEQKKEVVKRRKNIMDTKSKSLNEKKKV